MSSREPKRGRRPVSLSELRRSYGELDDKEKISFAAWHFCRGETPSRIGKLLSEHFGEEVRREEPYRLLQLGAALGYFHYQPPLEVELGERLRSEWRSIRHAHVVNTIVLDHVTARAADVLLGLIREVWAEKRNSHQKTGVPDDEEADTVRIGLAGGRTVRKIVEALAELLKRADPDTIPGSLGFHTACTGIHYHDFSTDPNAFISHLLRVPGVDIRTFAVPYQAPPVTRPNLRDLLETEPLIEEAAKAFPLVDILVTSGSSWRIEEIADSGEIQPTPLIARNGDKDADPLSEISSQLKTLMSERDEKGLEKLIRAGTIADMLWQPLSFEGPVEIDTDVRAMTLVLLRELPAFIEANKKVLLALGPYYVGGVFHKGDVLLATLGGRPGSDRDGRPDPLFTHLVCDHRTARAALKADDAASGRGGVRVAGPVW